MPKRLPSKTAARERDYSGLTAASEGARLMAWLRTSLAEPDGASINPPMRSLAPSAHVPWAGSLGR
jgi:hypothetical protein